MNSLFPPLLPNDKIGDVARQRTKEPIVLDLAGLASRLIELRNGRTYEAMAEATGISAAQYYRLENQEKPNVSANLLVLLARRLGVSVAYLIEGPAASRHEAGPYGVAAPGSTLQELVRQEVRQEVKRLMPVQDDAPANKSKVARKNRR